MNICGQVGGQIDGHDGVDETIPADGVALPHTGHGGQHPAAHGHIVEPSPKKTFDGNRAVFAAARISEALLEQLPGGGDELFRNPTFRRRPGIILPWRSRQRAVAACRGRACEDKQGENYPVARKSTSTRHEAPSGGSQENDGSCEKIVTQAQSKRLGDIQGAYLTSNLLFTTVVRERIG